MSAIAVTEHLHTCIVNAPVLSRLAPLKRSYMILAPRKCTDLLTYLHTSMTPQICVGIAEKVFTALHEMQTRSSDEKAVCLSVSWSNAWIVTKRRKDLSRFLYHRKDHLAEFSEKKNGWCGATPSTSVLDGQGHVKRDQVWPVQWHSMHVVGANDWPRQPV